MSSDEPELMPEGMVDLCVTLAGGRLSDRMGKTYAERKEWMRQYLDPRRTIQEGVELIDWLRSLPEVSISQPATPPAPAPTTPTPNLPSPTTPARPLSGVTWGPQTRGRVDLDPGVYEVRDPGNPQQIGKIYVVKWNKTSTAKYAMTVTFEEKDGKFKGSLEYDRSKPAGGMFEISPGDRMSKIRAVALSSMFGFCIRCTRTLSDPKSVEQSMGPVCVKKI